jgi:hypothetical protein
LATVYDFPIDDAPPHSDDDDPHIAVESRLSTAMTTQVVNGGPVTQEQLRETAKKAMQSQLLTTQQLYDIKPPQALVGGFLQTNSLAMGYGQSGHGKTHVFLDIALHVGGGFGYWHTKDRTVLNGPVVYVVAEGLEGVGPRVKAWADHHRAYGLTERPIFWYPRALQLYAHHPGQTVADDAALFAEILADLVPLKPVLVLFDTLARCAVGAEENSSMAMGKVVAAADAIRAATGACVLLVHHSGKNDENGARGSSALRAAMDTEIKVSMNGDEITVKVTKQKNAAPAEPMRFVLTEVAESVVLTPSWKSASDELRHSDAAVLRILTEIDTGGGVTKATWRDVATDETVHGHVGRSAFYAAVKRLQDGGFVHNAGTDKQPRYVPVSAGHGDEGSLGDF